MRIYFIRHAEAVNADEFDGPDLLRPLTRSGRKRARAAYRRLARIFPAPDIIVSSEAVRAEQTAEILHASWRKSALKKNRLLNPGRGVNGFRSFFKTLGKTQESVAVVGHEPDFSEIISHLVASGKLDLRLKKGACAEVEVNVAGRGRLCSLLTLDAMVGEK